MHMHTPSRRRAAPSSPPPAGRHPPCTSDAFRLRVREQRELVRRQPLLTGREKNKHRNPFVTGSVIRDEVGIHGQVGEVELGLQLTAVHPGRPSYHSITISRFSPSVETSRQERSVDSVPAAPLTFFVVELFAHVA